MLASFTTRGSIRMASAIACLVLTAFLSSQAQDDGKKEDKENAEDKLISGPKVGTLLPGPCEVFNINRAYKGRHHCLVCEYASEPAVIVFTRELAEGKDGPVTALIDKLEETIPNHETPRLHAFVVFLSPAARSSATEKKIEDTDKLVEEAAARDALHARLAKRAEKLKRVTVACTIPEGPKGYKLNPKAEVTVIFYTKLKVIENFTFAPGKMNEEDAGKIVDKIDKDIEDAKKGKKKN